MSRGAVTILAFGLLCLLLTGAAARETPSAGPSPPGGSPAIGRPQLEATPAPIAPPMKAPADSAAPRAPRARPASRRGSETSLRIKPAGAVALQFIYDDNILRYSDGVIDEFRANLNPAKFHTETYDDLIVSPRMFLNFSARPLRFADTKLYVTYLGYLYGRNPIKNNATYQVRLRQYVNPRNYFQAGYSYSPPSYIRHLSDRPPYTPRTVPLAWIPFKSVRHGIDLGYSHRLRSWLNASLEVGRVLRFYNRPFLENDNWEWNGSVGCSVTRLRNWRFAGTYTYSNVEARARDSVTETAGVSDDGDPSYERDLYELVVGFRPRGKLWAADNVEVKGQLQAYYFTGDRLYWEDPLHTGREDKVYVLETTIGTRPVYGPVTLEVGYRYSQRVSSLPATFEGEDAEDKDYKDNRTWIEARYSF